MAQVGSEFCLVFEGGFEVGDTATVVRDNLHRHGAVQAEITGTKDPPHRAPAEKLLQEVAFADGAADFEISAKLGVVRVVPVRPDLTVAVRPTEENRRKLVFVVRVHPGLSTRDSVLPGGP